MTYSITNLKFYQLNERQFNSPTRARNTHIFYYFYYLRNILD